MSAKIIETSYKELDRGLREIASYFWDNFPQAKGKTIFVKPNLVIPPTAWEQASTTRIEVINLVIRKLIEDGASEIIVGGYYE